MKKLKSVIALVLVMLMALSCVACSSGDAQSAGKTRAVTDGKKNNSLTVAVTDQVTTFDPYLFMLSIEDSVIMQMYEPLFYVDNDGNYMWRVAESMTENEDGSVTFQLRKDLKFHSGDTVTMEDIEYSFSRCQFSTLCSVLSQTVELETDDNTVTFKFPMADQGYDYNALRPYMQLMCIMNKSYCEQYIDALDGDMKFNVDGTGPFCFESKNEAGDVTIKKFDGYYGDVALDSVNFKYVSGSVETAFESGDIDLSIYTASNFKLLDQYSNVTKLSLSVNNVTMLINNCLEGQKTADKRVREAIVYAMNREDVCTIGSDDAGTVAYNMANPQIKYWKDDICTKYERDVDKANALLAEAGYSESNKCELTLVVMSAQPTWVSACEVMKEALEQANFKINIEQVADTSRYFTYDFDLAMISIALTTNFNSFADLYNMDSGINLAGITDDEVTAAFAAMTDEASTQAAMKTATESHAYIPLFYNTYFYAFDSDLNYGPMYNEISAFLYSDFSWKE